MIELRDVSKRYHVVGVGMRIDDEGQTPVVQYGIDNSDLTRLLRANQVSTAVARIELSENKIDMNQEPAWRRER